MTSESAVPTTVKEVPGFPYPSFDEFVAAVRRHEAFLGVDQAFAIQWVHLSASSGGAPVSLLHGFLGWAMVWVGLVVAVVAWGDLGPFALGLIAMSFVASTVSRPWRGRTLALVAFVVAVIGAAAHIPWLQWSGATWVATYLVFRFMYADATRRFTHDLLRNEKQLAAALTPTPTAQAHIVTGDEIRRGGGDWRKSGA